MKYVFVLATVLIAKVMSEVVDQNSQNAILYTHNYYRRRQNAANMNKLVWDNVLAQEVDNWITTCQFWYPETTRGHNLYVTTKQYYLIHWAMYRWYAESARYDYSANECNSNYGCGHYKQMMWATTKRIGCAAHFCPIANPSEYNNFWFFGCNYDPAGNVTGPVPFIQGPACSQCSTGQSCDLDWVHGSGGLCV